MTENPDQSGLNLRCLLPDHHVGVSVWAPHPCGGWYVLEAWCYGPRGRVGYWIEENR